MIPGAPPKALTDLYVQRLDTIRRRAGAGVALWFARFPLDDMTDAAWAELLAGLYVTWLGVQLQGVAAADAYMAATAVHHGAQMPLRPLVTVPYVGRSVSGALVLDVLAAVHRFVDDRIAKGIAPASALGESRAYLTAVVGSEPHRIARDAVLDAAQAPTGPVIAWARIAEPGACKFCRMLATRGAVYTSEQTATVTTGAKRYHHNCRCHAEPVTSGFEQARSIKLGQTEWRRMLDAGEAPGQTRGTRAPAEATAADVRRHQELQLQQLEASIPDLRRRVAAGDEAARGPLAWQQGRVDELRRVLLTRAAA